MQMIRTEMSNRATCAARLMAFLLTSAALPGCGGGGGGGTTAPPLATGALTVGWTANNETDLAGYKVYYGTTAGIYLQPKGAGLNAGLATEYAIAGLEAGSTYYVVVTSYDNSGNESAYSVQVSGVAK